AASPPAFASAIVVAVGMPLIGSTAKSSVPIPFLPLDVVTMMSYLATGASAAMVTLAVSLLTEPYLVALTRSFGWTTPFSRKSTVEPRSKPLPLTWTSSVTSRPALSGSAAVTVTVVVAPAFARLGSPEGSSTDWQPARMSAAAIRPRRRAGPLNQVAMGPPGDLRERGHYRSLVDGQLRRFCARPRIPLPRLPIYGQLLPFPGHPAVPREGVPRPVIRASESRVREHRPLRADQSPDGTLGGQPPVVLRREGRGALVVHPPQRGDHVPGARVEEGARQRREILSLREARAPGCAEPGFADGQEHERATDRESEDLVDLQSAIGGGVAGPAGGRREP